MNNKKEMVVTIPDDTDLCWQESLTVKPKYYINKQKELKEKLEIHWLQTKHSLQKPDLLSKYMN